MRTWCGALLQHIHVVWPRFRVQLLDRLSWTGGPLLGRHRESLANQFLEALLVQVASEAVRRFVCTPAIDSAGPHPLSYITSSWLRATTGYVGPQDTLRTPIFARCPGVNTDACRVMLRTLAGMEDFARTNAHFSGGIRTPRYDTAFVRGSAYIVFSICRTNVWIRNGMHIWTVH